MFFIWQTEWKAQKKPFLTSRVKFQETRFRRRPVQPISSAYATSKDSRLGRRTGQPIRAGVRGQASKIGGKQCRQEQQGAVSHRCHTGVTPVSHRCHVSSIRSASCLYKSPATCTPQCPTEVALDMRGSSWVYSDHSRNPASTSARATLSTSTPPSTMFVQHPQTSPLTRILVLPMRVCIRQTSHRGGSGSSQGRMERARRTRSWPSARSSRWPTSLQKH